MGTVELSYERRGCGEPLLLIHGIGSRWQMWDPVLDRLARERDVIAVDLPGFGFSPMPSPGVRAGAGSLSGLLAAWLRSMGLERVHVAGNSLGGWVSLELAKRGVARSVTALSPAGFYTQPEAILMVASLRLSRRMAQVLRPDVSRLAAHQAFRGLSLWQLLARPRQMPAFDVAEAVRALADAPWFDDTLAAISRERFHSRGSLGVPVTIAWGEHDRLLLRRQAARARAEVPDARVVVLEGCGHVPTYDDPAQVARVILEGSAAG